MRCKKYQPENVKKLVQEVVLKQNPKFNLSLKLALVYERNLPTKTTRRGFCCPAC